MYNDPLHLLKYKTRMKTFSHTKGELNYKIYKDTAVIAGDPHCTDLDSAVEILNDFQKQNPKLCGYYFSKELSEHLSLKLPNVFKFYELGVTQKVDLQNFHTEGYKKRDVRRALNFGKENLNFYEVKQTEKIKNIDEILSLEKKWLKSKRWFWFINNKIEFLLSSPKIEFENSNLERWFIVRDCCAIYAFVSVIRNGNSYYLDHMIYDPTKNRKSLDYLISEVIYALKKERAGTLSLGLNPFKKIRPSFKLEYLFWLNGKMNWFYNSQGIFRFKNKFSDQSEKKFLMLSQKHMKINQLLVLFKVTYPN